MFRKLTITTLLIISSVIFAQKQFEGIITYNINYPEEKVSDQGKEYIPKQQSTYYKDGMMRMETKTTAMDMTIMSNDKTHVASFMFNFMGMKMALNTTKEEIRDILNDNANYQIRYTKNKKTIAGYKCKEAILTAPEGQATIYVCDALKVGNSNWFVSTDVKGAILEIVIQDDQDNFTLTALEVKKTELNAAYFNIPEGYIQIGQKELEGMFGGQSPF